MLRTPPVSPQRIASGIATDSRRRCQSRPTRSFRFSEQRPLPPMPNMTRLGVTGDNTITLSLNDAIKRALENNNEIEVRARRRALCRNATAFTGRCLRSILSFTPQIDKRIYAAAEFFAAAQAAPVQPLARPTRLTPSVNKQFCRGGGNLQSEF